MPATVSNTSPKDRIGLALSGGGFRATLFHIGTLWRLNELGWLSRLDELSSVSGGSITAAWLGLNWKSLDFDADGIAGNFEVSIAKPLEAFCKRNIDAGSIIGGLISPFYHPGQLITRAYRKHLFGDATLRDLPDRKHGGPRFTLYATSMQTGSSVRLTRAYVGDYRIGLLRRATIPLALAVAASSAFPPLLCPIRIACDPDAWQPVDGADLYIHRNLRAQLYLADGGVYDNLGLETLSKTCDTLLVSDAGAPLGIEYPTRIRRFGQLRYTLRVLNIISGQTRALRKRKLIGDILDGRKKGAYWGIASKIGDYHLESRGLAPALARDNRVTLSLAGLRTRLNHFDAEEQGRLINWGYALADAAMRRYVLAGDAPPANWPRPAFPLKDTGL